jgi:hypothetical protein
MNKIVDIIVPYRDRAQNLKIFMEYMRIYLGKELKYKISIIEQNDDLIFNKGFLINAGFKIIKPKHYFWMHDVDLLPVRSEYHIRDYNCQLCNYATQFRFTGIDQAPFCGGVVGFLPKDFKQINGYSIEFEGWGGEDDFMSRKDIRYIRDEQDYVSLPHKYACRDPKRFETLRKVHHRGLKETKFDYIKVSENHYKVKNKIGDTK